MNNKIKTSLVIFSSIFLIAFSVFFIFKEKDQEALVKVENFDLYQEMLDPEEKNLNADCANEEFNQLRKLTELGQMKKLVLVGGLEIRITPNYYNWNNEKFLSFNDPESGAFCGEGGFFPLYADRENLWWIQSCSSGYRPNEDDINYQDFINCQESEKIVLDYFAKK
ncbi:MAG: hypothetical protein PHO91_01470 [Patescibacteria group bacterium]|nr:hypothetical protein [Patescibacteria group bacterium]